MKELDCVRLLEDFENIPKGTEGAIVIDYRGPDVEVEFFDKEGDTIDILTVPRVILEVTHSYN